MSQECDRCRELSQKVDRILEKLTQVTNTQLTEYRRQNMSRFMALDKELELIMGEKERSIGELREHRREHGLASDSLAS